MTKLGYKWTEEHRRNGKAAARKRFQNPDYRRKQKSGCQRNALNTEWRDNQKINSQELYKDPEYRCKHKISMQLLTQNPEWRRKNKLGAQKRAQDPEYRLKQKEAMQRIVCNPEYKIAQKEGFIGGFWYGNVRYIDRKYCELWCSDLWHRIDEAQNHRSILSGKTKFDNGGLLLSRHHVYWQKKACCEWDEDTQGYFAMINIGTRGKPKWYKHYIPGDPNKFVLLTKQEHGMVAKDKLKWIKIFEDLIETKLGGVCYLPKVA